MTRRLSAHELANGRLSLTSIGDGSHQVQFGGMIVGEIMARRRSFGRRVWFWSLSGPHLPEAMQPAGSNAQTLEGAKSAIKAAFDRWMELATGSRGDVSWQAAPPSHMP